jgi:hypothetical protein
MLFPLFSIKRQIVTDSAKVKTILILISRMPTSVQSTETAESTIIRPLTGCYNFEGDYEDLLDWGNVRYHSVLQYNEDNPCAEENVALKGLWAAMATDDQHELQEAAQRCFSIVYPFLRDDYERRCQVLTDKPGPTLVKIQVVTRDDRSLQVIEHDKHLKYPVKDPIENTFPGLPIFSASTIESLEEIFFNISKVKFRDVDSVYCIKTVHRSDERALGRELSILSRCSHPNIIRCIGLVEPVDDGGKVEGIVLEYIENTESLHVLSESGFSPVDCERWITQIRDALEYLHENNLIWGDVKADNVLLRGNGDVVLVDFGGGFTTGWIEHQYNESVMGDWQGFQKIVQFLRSKIRTNHDAAAEAHL